MASRDKKPAKPSGSGRIRTFADLNRQSGPPDSDGESDAPQEFYTGGEKSGMLVQEPTKGNDVDAIFNKAREMGAVEKRVEHAPSSSSRSFTGTGRLLSRETVPSSPQQPEAVVHNIVFWSNGFTVNDGPLRRLDDPENAPFIESIGRSECPKELEPADRMSSVNVNLIKRAEKCPEPEKSQVSFQGVGRTLGSSSSGNPSEPSGAAPALTTAPAPSPSVGLVVDPALPVTSIQLRLADGTRLVARFNLHHTVNDIRGFIDASRPGGSRDYQLQMMGFPPKVVTNVNQTVEDAGLANAVIIQKF